MKKSEIINLVKKALLTQGKRSMLQEGYSGCAYRDGKGNKCAIGHLIPDELYNHEIEGHGIFEVSVYYDNKVFNNVFKYLMKLGDFDDRSEAIDFYEHLQAGHDTVSVDQWEHFYDKMLRNYKDD